MGAIVYQLEAMMQKSIPLGGDKLPRLPNPLLDISIVALETQLKAWQAYQVEGTRFVAKRLSANLEFMRSLGHCGDIQSMGACQLAWLNDLQKDYAEEYGRIAGTSFTLGFADLTGLGWLFGKRTAEGCREPQPGPQSTGKSKSPSSLQAAA